MQKNMDRKCNIQQNKPFASVYGLNEERKGRKKTADSAIGGRKDYAFFSRFSNACIQSALK